MAATGLRWLPDLATAAASLGGPHVPKLSRGLLAAYGLPLAAIGCFVFPERLKWWLSPRPPPEFEYLLTESFWYFLGYVLLALSVGVLLLFR
jgi:hypothetical protein